MSSEQCIFCWETCPDPRRCSRCKKYACRRCLKTFLLGKIEEGRVEENLLSCPNFECNVPFPMAELQILLDADACAKVTQLREIIRVNRDPRWCWCPNAKCGAAARRLPHSGVLPESFSLSRRARCEDCKQEFCCRCGARPHRGRCARDDSYVQWRKKVATRGDNDGVQECPRCHHHIEKQGGCQHMSCSVCGEQWCWLCLRPWRHHHASLCRAVRTWRERCWTGNPIKRAAAVSVAVPSGLCAGAVVLAFGTVIGAGWVVGLATYTAVSVPGKRAKEVVRRRWRERKQAVETKRAKQNEDVPEDVRRTSAWCADHPFVFEY